MVNFFTLCSEQTNNFDTVTWSHSVNIIIIAHNIHWRWCLTFRNIFWQLLNFDILFISKMTIWMNNLEGIFELAINTRFWFANSCIFKLDRYLCFASKALEHSCFHLWIDFTASDNYTSETNKSIDMMMIETSHKRNFNEFDNRYHQHISFVDLMLFCLGIVSISKWIDKLFLIHVFYNLIKNRDHFCWIKD